ncbi:MAG: hypothetical protein CM1200mP32_10090 [Methanobacteriota archaeon]|nr:MAG: hypothetical protein CM1200mP32_10090 [Euryarchaeota archaeon]
MRKPIVTVFGSNDLSEAPEVEVLCEDLGRAIVDLGCRVACGGLGGSMTAVCRGAQSSQTYQRAIPSASCQWRMPTWRTRTSTW